MTICFILRYFVPVGNPVFHDEIKPENDEHASWINDEDLKNGAIDLLQNEEIEFWQEFIEKYLKPLNHDKEHQKQVSIIMSSVEHVDK